MTQSKWGKPAAYFLVACLALGVIASFWFERKPIDVVVPPLAGATQPNSERDTVFTNDALRTVLLPLTEQLEAGAFAGAAVAIGVGAQEVHLLGLGKIGWTRNAAAVNPDSTMYDMASLTKVIATASATLLLVDDGRLSLDDPVSNYLPEFLEGPKAQVTVRHLLTHTSGLPEGSLLEGTDRADRLARVKSLKIYPPAGVHVAYSDVGYIVLWEVAEAAAGEPLTAYLDRRLFGPLGMTSTRFSPGLDCEACAPTGRLRDQTLFRGKPFDPTGQRLDGVGGQSGLFSTAHDVSRFIRMLFNGGELDGVRILERTTVREFVGPQPVGENRYRLGWEVLCENLSEEVVWDCPSPHALGHTGWTGTSILLDPSTGAWVVLLTNRTYEPRAPNKLQDVRRQITTNAIAQARAAMGRGVTTPEFAWMLEPEQTFP